MKFESYYSSSRGNLYCVTAANGKRLLIDPGVPWKKMLKALNHNLSNIAGCLISHEHADHSKAVEDVMENGIDVYASEGTFKAIEPSLHLHRKAFVIRTLNGTNIESEFRIFPFAVQHDAIEPLGFVIQERPDKDILLFVTDTSHVKQKFGLAFSIVALCCNYDGDVLAKREETGDINTELAKRLLASHMEWHETKRYVKEFCCLDKCTEIHLLHMSGDNLDKEAVRAEFEREFFTKTFIAGKERKHGTSTN